MTHTPSHRPRATRKPARAPAHAGFDATAFDTIALRHRHDGWTPAKQVAFVEALSECGCVEDACRRVGISSTAAYALRRRVDAQSFRIAWDMALDHAIQRLADAAFARAIHGVAQPVFYKGEQIGERRTYDERLTMFLLRYRDPVRYGAWHDRTRAERSPDAAAITLSKAVHQLEVDAYDRDAGAPLGPRMFRPVVTRYITPDEEERLEDEAADRRDAARARREQAQRDADSDAELAGILARDVPATSATSAAQDRRVSGSRRPSRTRPGP